MDVSVLTPSYEYGRSIAFGIGSVIQQGLRLQHIIQDAGPGDETLEVLPSFGDRVEWASDTDLGQSDDLNRALAEATGDWIAWLNEDEYYVRDAFESWWRKEKGPVRTSCTGTASQWIGRAGSLCPARSTRSAA
jgi:glycosyltransferase involved in cell wall biosynthesis